MGPADETGATATARVRRRLIPFLFLLYVVAYLDRVNVGFAALDMNRDLGFSGAVYGLGSGIFFLSYFLLEVPSNLALARLGARVWIARIMASWGVLSAAMVFVHDATSFYVLRFLLGAAEAGFFPGVIYYLTHWFPVRDRAHAVALFLTATAIAGVIGAPLSSALLLLDGTWGLRGWQWLFLVEGLPAVLLAPVVLAFLTERPADAAWLTHAERRWLAAEMARDAEAAPYAHASFGAAVGDARLWRLSVIYGCLVVAFYGVGFWLPQIVQGLSGYPSSVVALISAIPYMAAAVGMVLVGASSDRTGERQWHVAGPALIGAAGFAATALGPSGVWWSVATLSLAALGVYSALGPFWALPATLLRGPAAAGGIAVINSIGNLGGFVGPSVVGLVRDRTGSFAGGLGVLAMALAVGAALTLTLPRGQGRRPE